MRYVLSTAPQLFIMALLTGLIASVGPIAYMIHRDMKLLPVVTLTKEGQCVKVTNYENGHAFSCQDVDVLLRRYRKLTVAE